MKPWIPLIAAAVFLAVGYLTNVLFFVLFRFITNDTTGLLVSDILAFVSAAAATIFVVRRMNARYRR